MKKCRKYIIIYFLLINFSLILCLKFFIPKVENLLNIFRLSNGNNYHLRILEAKTDSKIDTLSDSSQITDNFSSIIGNSSETLDIYSNLIDTSSGDIESYVITDDISSEMDNSSIINSDFSESISVITSDSLSQLINSSSDFIDMSSDLSDSISDKVNTSWVTEDSITELEDIPTISTTDYTDNLTDEFITDIKTDDSVKNNSADTKNKIPMKSSGLSTGEILIIVIPCILFLLVMSIIIAICGCNAKHPPEKIDAPAKVENFETSTNILKDEKLQPEIVPPKQIIYYQIINNQTPSIPKINKVFEPMLPSTKIVTIKKTFQPVIVKKLVKVVKPIQQQPKISEIKNPMPKPEVIISSSKILPESHTSEIRDSKVLPIKYLPKIMGETQILPLKVLPPIDLGHKTVLENENDNISNYSRISGNLVDNSIENLSHFNNAPQNLTDKNLDDLSKSLKVSEDLLYNVKENTSQISKVTEEIVENKKKDTFINIPKIDNNKMTESKEDFHHIIQKSDSIPINFSDQMTNSDK